MALDVKRLKLPTDRLPAPANTKPPTHRSGQKFLKGPIPWNWIQLAGRQGGRCLHVALVLWLLAGINRCRVVELSTKLLEGVGVNRWTAYRALGKLERARLVTVKRGRGRLARVTLQDAPPAASVTDDSADI